MVVWAAAIQCCGAGHVTRTDCSSVAMCGSRIWLAHTERWSVELRSSSLVVRALYIETTNASASRDESSERAGDPRATQPDDLVTAREQGGGAARAHARVFILYRYRSLDTGILEYKLVAVF